MGLEALHLIYDDDIATAIYIYSRDGVMCHGARDRWRVWSRCYLFTRDVYYCSLHCVFLLTSLFIAFSYYRVYGALDGLRVDGVIDDLRVDGVLDDLRVDGALDDLRVDGAGPTIGKRACPP